MNDVLLIAGPFHIVAAMLVVAGVTKLRRPTPTIDVLRAAGLPSGKILVSGFGTAEVAAGVTAITIGGRIPALAVAILYGAFVVFVVSLIVRGIEVADCGCFGAEAEAPPGLLHIAVDGMAAVVALIAAAGSVSGIGGVLADQPLGGLPYVGFALLGTWLAVAVLTELPQLDRLAAEGAS